MEKKIFEVAVRETWTRTFTVEAESRDEAAEIANNLVESGNSDGNFEYSHTEDLDEWYVCDVTEQIESAKKRGFEVTLDNKRG